MSGWTGMFARSVTLTVCVLMAVAPGLEAQGSGHGSIGSRFGGGLGVLAGLPVGEFATYVDASPGFGGYVLFDVDRRGALAVRADGSLIIYGSETIERPISVTIPRVRVDVTTENTIASFLLGPQLQVPSGPVRPFVSGGVGLSYFATRSSLDSADGFADDRFVTSTNFDDLTFAALAGGGLWVGVSRSVSITGSAHFLYNGDVRYLREGSIQDNTDGTISFSPIRSQANLVLVQIGVAVHP